MKKIVSLILVLLTAFSAAACAVGSSAKNEADSDIILVTDDANTGENTDLPGNDGQDSVASQLVGNWLQYHYSFYDDHEEMRYFPDGRLEFVYGEESTSGTYTISQSSEGDTLLFVERQYQDRISLETKTERFFSVLTNEIDQTTDFELQEALFRKYEDRYGEGDGEYRYAGVLSISDGILYDKPVESGPEIWVTGERIDTETPVSLEGVWFNNKGEYYVFYSDGTGEACNIDNHHSVTQILYAYDEQTHQLMLYEGIYEEKDGIYYDEYESELNPYTITGNIMESNGDSCWFKK